jgi:hypothetical protein
MRRTVVMFVVALLLAPAALTSTAADRATSPLTLEGFVLTGDGSGAVRGASVSLEIYNSLEMLVHLDLTVSMDEGNYSLRVPSVKWDPGWRALLKATYSLVGATVSVNHTLTASTTQRVDLALPWNRTLGAVVDVPQPDRTSERDSPATWTIDVDNEGNDTDSVTMWTTASNDSIQTVFNPGNSTVLAPGGARSIAMVASNPGLEPSTYDVTLHWRSLWYPSETGTVGLTWTVQPEVALSLPRSGISWYPDPLNDGDSALLNCTVVNGGRDPAPLANVTMELTHPVDGLVATDRVRIDVPAHGTANASFPWQAVYSEDPYNLRFEVEHPDNGGAGPTAAERPLTVGVDNVAPTVTFLSPPNTTSVNGTVTVRLRVTDPDSQVEHVRLSIGEGAYFDLPAVEEPTYAWDTTSQADGWYTLRAYATDAYSTGPVASWDLKVENGGHNTPPEVFIEAPLDGDTVESVLETHGIAFDTEDNVEEVTYRVDGGTWTPAEGTTRWNASIDVGSLGPGTHLLEVQASDGIDTSTIASVGFNVTDLPREHMDLTLVVDPATVLPEERVDVRGELVYGNGARAAGLQVRIEGPGGLLVYKEADSRGVFQLSVLAPDGEGTYTYSASASDGEGLSASNSTQLRVLKSLDPDLAVTAIRVESEKVAVGINVTVGVDLRNLGFTTGNGTFQAWEGDPGEGALVSERHVTVYDRITVSFEWMPGEDGEIDLTVQVIDVLPSDANLSNNRRTQRVLVMDLPDLVLTNITLSTEVPYDNTTFTVSVRVLNEGGLNASCTVRLYMDGMEADDMIGESDLAVSAYGFAFATFDTRASQGPHALYGEIINVYPEESRTYNNNGTRRITVQGPYVPPPPDDGGEDLLGGLSPVQFLGIIVAAIILAIVAVGLLRYG